jgi:hypothetical protein
MAFAGIFQPFARLRWIRFGLLMRAVNSRAAFRSANNGNSPPSLRQPDDYFGRVFGLSVDKEGWSVLISGPLLPPANARAARTSDRNRTSRFVIILSLAVFDRVNAEGLAASAEPDRETRRI